MSGAADGLAFGLLEPPGRLEPAAGLGLPVEPGSPSVDVPGTSSAEVLSQLTSRNGPDPIGAFEKAESASSVTGVRLSRCWGRIPTSASSRKPAIGVSRLNLTVDSSILATDTSRHESASGPR